MRAAPAMVTSSPTSHGTATATVLRIGRECILGSNSSSSRLTRWCQASAYTPSVSADSRATSSGGPWRPDGSEEWLGTQVRWRSRRLWCGERQLDLVPVRGCEHIARTGPLA